MVFRSIECTLKESTTYLVMWKINHIYALRWLRCARTIHDGSRERERNKEHQQEDVYRSAYKAHALWTIDALESPTNSGRLHVHWIIVDFEQVSAFQVGCNEDGSKARYEVYCSQESKY